MQTTFSFDSQLTVNRLGYGTMQLPGKGVFGPGANREQAVKAITTAIDAGVTFIDTADAYGPFWANLYLKEALQQRSQASVMVATKVGFTRQGPNQWTVVGDPAYLRQQVYLNLWSLGLDHLSLLQLHRIDPRFSLADQLTVLKDFQEAGIVDHIGLSQVTIDELKEAQQIVPIASVQNRYNLIDRQDEAVLNYAEEEHIAFIPWFPLATGELVNDQRLLDIAEKYQATPAQIALAWLLHRSDVILPIPGSQNPEHVKLNVAAQDIDLEAADFATLNQLA